MIQDNKGHGNGKVYKKKQKINRNTKRTQVDEEERG